MSREELIDMVVRMTLARWAYSGSMPVIKLAKDLLDRSYYEKRGLTPPIFIFASEVRDVWKVYGAV